MSATPLVIRIEDVGTGDCWVYVFDSGPVWLGWGPAASLPIVRPFITLQHGCFQFDHTSVRYQDLDPRSGTIVDGAPAGSNELTVTEWTRIEMGSLRISVSRRPPDGPVLDPGLSPFAQPPGAVAARAENAAVAPVPWPLPSAPTAVLPDAPPLPPFSPAPAAPWPQERGRSEPLLVHEREDPSFSLEEERPRSSPLRTRGSSSSRAERRPPRRRVKRRSSVVAWLSAFAVFVVIVGVAGLVLQYRGGLPWMPPELASRIPPWLATWFR